MLRTWTWAAFIPRTALAIYNSTVPGQVSFMYYMYILERCRKMKVNLSTKPPTPPTRLDYSRGEGAMADSQVPSQVWISESPSTVLKGEFGIQRD